MKSKSAVVALVVLAAIVCFYWIYHTAQVFLKLKLPLIEDLGNFGDSFGVVSGLLTPIAVIMAVYTTYLQNASSDRQQFENNFYNMIRSLENAREQSSVKLMDKKLLSVYFEKDVEYFRLKNSGREVLHTYSGLSAFQICLFRLRDKIGSDRYRDSKVVHSKYKEFVESGSFFSNYFRILYHIYQMLETLPLNDSVKYSRIIRAHLSNNEICILGYNISVGEGRFKFRRLALKYRILHNIKRENLDPYEKSELDFFMRKIGMPAFSFEDDEEFTYDS